MTRIFPAALAALALSSATISKADDLDDRLRVVAATDCSYKSFDTFPKVSACETAKIMAMNAYGQRLLMRQTCFKHPTCQYYVEELDRLIEEMIFNNKKPIANR